MVLNTPFPVCNAWQTLVKNLNLRPENILRRAALPEDFFSKRLALSPEDCFRLWRAMETESGDAMFPLRVIETLTAKSFNSALVAALCSGSFMQTIKRIAVYIQLACPIELEIDVNEAGELKITPRWMMVKMDVPTSLQVAGIGFLLRLARIAMREPVKPRQVILPAVPTGAHIRGYGQFFGIAVSQGTLPSITFSALDASRQFITAG
ncbi:AraC family transcriptional regulator ligand-binding domain-containing protein [Pantoea ananatis]|uniref:AraC family transcriptional regulator ligand-binding domain-containing protein n=1 Tax=Pantoea ananas TaxID=553 RepID=UPI000D5E4FB9|nr:AraC family transcriptional regulator ligand-binding domain-containing protein [Pantoea ananatis]PVY84017.1 AraC-type transcriptional regulator [Pantoea ananatis]